MTFQRLIVIRILLFVAQIVEQDETVRTEIKYLSNHINVNSPKEK